MSRGSMANSLAKPLAAARRRARRRGLSARLRRPGIAPDVVIDGDRATVSEPVEAAAEEIVQAAGSDALPIIAQTPVAADATEDADSMTAADFRDAEDNEDWARPDHANVSSGDGGDADAAPVVRPRLQEPPLKLEGFVPSAFSSGDESKAPDTSILGKLPVPLAHPFRRRAALRERGISFADRLRHARRSGQCRRPRRAVCRPLCRRRRLRRGDRALQAEDARRAGIPDRGHPALGSLARRQGADAGRAPFRRGRRACDRTCMARRTTRRSRTFPELKARIAEMRTIIDTATDGVVLDRPRRQRSARSAARPKLCSASTATR